MRAFFYPAVMSAGGVVEPIAERARQLTRCEPRLFPEGSVTGAFCGHRQQLLLMVPVERLVVLFGFVAAFFQSLEDGDLFVGHEVQTVAAEEPQQVAGN